jgi:hypothetical protein
MPYDHEIANPLGHINVFSNQALAQQVREWKSSSSRGISKELSQLITSIHPQELADTIPLETVSKALAVDGSVVQTSPSFPLEAAVVNIAQVTQDISLYAQVRKEYNGEEWKKVYTYTNDGWIFPGQGIYLDDLNTRGYDALRTTFGNILSDYRLQEDSETLFELLSKITTTRQVRCIDCDRADSVIDFGTSLDPQNCSVCGRIVYFTDVVLNELLRRPGRDPFVQIMLLLEKLILHGGVRKLSASPEGAHTLFILDGPLTQFTQANLNAMFLRDLQRQDTPPLLVGIEKTGSYHNWLARPGVGALFRPGRVTMVTDALEKYLRGRRDQPIQNKAYGKHFIYRTLDGRKAFVFTLPPARGQVHGSGEQEFFEAWDNYPHLRLVCDYIELTQTHRFGPSTAALDILAEANHRASLPTKLSSEALDRLLQANFMS